MKSILITIAIVLLTIWAVGFFLLNAAAMIHILLVIAIVFILLRIIQGKAADKKS